MPDAIMSRTGRTSRAPVPGDRRPRTGRRRLRQAVDLNEECLCFGWIDSKPGKVDGQRTALLCTPRKPGSGWSKVNKHRLERLLAETRVAPAGLLAIEAAKADGSWSKLDAVDALDVPDDLATALAAYPSQVDIRATVIEQKTMTRTMMGRRSGRTDLAQGLFILHEGSVAAWPLIGPQAIQTAKASAQAMFDTAS